MKTTLCTAIIYLLAAISSSCRKTLCYEPTHPHDGYIEVHLDRALMEGNRQELRLIFYPATSGRAANTEPYVRFVSADRSVIDIPQGTYSIIAYNEESEYISFRGMESYTTAEAYMEHITRSEYTKSNARNKEEITIGQPDNLYVMSITEFEVTADVTKQQSLALKPRSVVITLKLNIEFDGIERVRQARGALSGIAQSIFLHSGVANNSQPVTSFFNCKLTPTGISTEIASFGILSEYESQTEVVINMLTLELMLKDGSVSNFEFDISRYIHDNDLGGGGDLSLKDLEIDVPDIDPDAGFNPDQGDWDNEDNIEIRTRYKKYNTTIKPTQTNLTTY